MVPDGEKKGGDFLASSRSCSQVCVNTKKTPGKLPLTSTCRKIWAKHEFYLQQTTWDSPGLMGKEKLPVHARSRCHSRSKSQVRHPNHRIPWGDRKLKVGKVQKKWNSKKWSQKKLHGLLLFPLPKFIHICSQVFQKPSGCLWFLW